MLKRFARDDRGATATEYALIAGIFAIFTVATVQAVYVETTQSFENVGSAIAIGNAEAPLP